MTITAVWNPASGSAPDEADLRDALTDSAELVKTTAEDPGPGQTHAAVASGASTVVACGGDGTIRACLKPLLHSNTALDIVPLGTGNLLAANLDIPSGLSAAGDAGHRPQTTIDVGMVNGEAFAVMAGSGFDAYMIRDADESAKSRLGRLAYVMSAAKHLADALTPTSVYVDDELWFRGRTSMVLVGNYGVVTGGLVVFPDAKPNDGLLDVAVLAAEAGREWGSVLWRLVRKQTQKPELVSRAQGRTIRVETTRKRPYELDGEARAGVRRLEFSIEEQALKIHHGVSS